MGNDNPFCRNAGQKCSTTDVVLYQNRAYGRALGRWLSRDPIGERGGVNLYAAMVNEPQKLFDALGLECVGHSCSGYDEDGLHFCGPPSPPPTPRPHDPHG
ncbi:RHS repeat-associated core domain-containing protein [Limisphaera ngatamarikiensis]|uniref:RHS repeat-associated core domain-containing protein n=1 Tax=Limisphaera ngatamarikiensis TaxID=1324935 RepID=UPI003CCD3F1C